MRRVLAIISLLFISGLFVGCGNDNQTAPENNPIVSLAVVPSSATIPQGGSQQFRAIGTLQDGSQVDYTGTVTWSTTNSSVVAIHDHDDQAGLANAVGFGTAQIVATTAAAQTAGANVTVGTSTFSVTPLNPSLNTGSTVQLVGTSTTGGVGTDVTAGSTFNSSNPAVATVSNSGLVTGVSAGTAVITASNGGQTSITTVTVNPVTSGLTGLSLAPGNLVLSNGTTSQLVATGTFVNGSSADITNTTTFTSSNATVATVSSGGLITAVGSGTAVISGTSGTQTGTTQVTVP